MPVSIVGPSIGPPIIALSGAGHQHVKAPSTSSIAASNPVPVASELKSGTVGTPYSETITAQGGTSPYTFAVTSGSLPTGLTMTTGVISGTPTTAATSTFTVTVTDTASATGSQSFSIIVATATGGGGAGGSYVFIF